MNQQRLIISFPACWTGPLPQTDRPPSLRSDMKRVQTSRRWCRLLTWLLPSYFSVTCRRGGWSSTLPEQQRTVTRGDNVNVLRLYLDERDIMSLNVDKAEPLLPKGRPLWLRWDVSLSKMPQSARAAALNCPLVGVSDIWVMVWWNQWLIDWKQTELTVICVDNRSFFFRIWWWEFGGCRSIFLYYVAVNGPANWLVPCNLGVQGSKPTWPPRKYHSF